MNQMEPKIKGTENPGLKFLRKFSSIKDEYEAQKRNSLSSSEKIRLSRVPNLSQTQTAIQASQKLWATTSKWPVIVTSCT